MLIAHPRKSNNANLENDDIAGSSNITDKADIVLTYSKPNPADDPDPDHRRLGITKNRLTGKLREKEKLIWLVYDPKSRRVALNTCDFRNMDFKWNTDPYEQVSQDSMEIIPF